MSEKEYLARICKTQRKTKAGFNTGENSLIVEGEDLTVVKKIFDKLWEDNTKNA